MQIKPIFKGRVAPKIANLQLIFFFFHRRLYSTVSQCYAILKKKELLQVESSKDQSLK